MLPVWNQLSTTHNTQNKFIIAKVDCTIDTELCSNEDVLGYPTFIFYKKSNPDGRRFNDEVSFENFELFMFEEIYKVRSKIKI